MNTVFDNCDGCGEDYELNAVKDRLFLFINQPRFNFVQAMCPHCGTTTRVFIIAAHVCDIQEEFNLPVQWYTDPSEEVAERRIALDALEAKDELPELPRNMAMELDRDIHRLMYGEG